MSENYKNSILASAYYLSLPLIKAIASFMYIPLLAYFGINYLTLTTAVIFTYHINKHIGQAPETPLLGAINSLVISVCSLFMPPSFTYLLYFGLTGFLCLTLDILSKNHPSFKNSVQYLNLYGTLALFFISIPVFIKILFTITTTTLVKASVIRICAEVGVCLIAFATKGLPGIIALISCVFIIPSGMPAAFYVAIYKDSIYKLAKQKTSSIGQKIFFVLSCSAIYVNTVMFMLAIFSTAAILAKIFPIMGLAFVTSLLIAYLILTAFLYSKSLIIEDPIFFLDSLLDLITESKFFSVLCAFNLQGFIGKQEANEVARKVITLLLSHDIVPTGDEIDAILEKPGLDFETVSMFVPHITDKQIVTINERAKADPIVAKPYILSPAGIKNEAYLYVFSHNFMQLKTKITILASLIHKSKTLQKIQVPLEVWNKILLSGNVVPFGVTSNGKVFAAEKTKKFISYLAERPKEEQDKAYSLLLKGA